MSAQYTLDVLPCDIWRVILECCDGPSQLTLREVCKGWLAIAEDLAGRDYDSRVGLRGINCLIYVRKIRSLSNDHRLSSDHRLSISIDTSSTQDGTTTQDRITIQELYLCALNDSIDYEKLRLAKFVINTLISQDISYRDTIVNLLSCTSAYPTPFWAGITRALVLHKAPVERYINLVLAVYMDDIDLVKLICTSYDPRDAPLSPYPDNPCPIDCSYSYSFLEFMMRYNYIDMLDYIGIDKYTRISSWSRKDLERMNPTCWEQVVTLCPQLGSPNW